MNKYKLLDKLIYYISIIVAFVTFLILALVIFFILKESIGFFKSESVKSVFTWSWKPLSKNASYGLLPMISGTMLAGFLATFVALPVSIGSGLFISKYIKGKLKSIVLSIIDMLAGIPSVVYGFLSLITIVKFFEKSGAMVTGESIIAAVITLSIMVIPFMLSSYVKAFDAINKKYYFQTQALGVSSWYSLTHLILVIAKGHILSGYMLALSRALGETMAVMMVIGNSPIAPKLFGKGITLSGLIALEMSGSQLGSLHYRSLFAAGSVLMLLLLFVNYFIRVLDRRVKENEV